MVTKQQTLELFLRDAIARGRLKPGTRLKQQALARQFGVSPTPVRETLRRLQGDGLVLYAPNRGITITRIEFPEVEEIYLMRMALEGLAVQSATARSSSADLDALDSLQERLDRATTQGRLKSVRDRNYDFHMMIYGLARYERLLQFIQSLWGLFPWETVQVIPGRAETSMKEHHAILDAIRSGNGPKAAATMQFHISQSFSALRQFLHGKAHKGSPHGKAR
jgi:DNA-binding GntR family transcriptional regulator